MYSLLDHSTATNLVQITIPSYLDDSNSLVIVGPSESTFVSLQFILNLAPKISFYKLSDILSPIC